MKILRTLLSFGLAAAMLLTACAPLAEVPEAPAPTEPAEKPQEPEQSYSEFAGKEAYIIDPQVDAQAVKAAAEANNAFALALYQQLAESDGNLFYSPYSIYTALMMTYAGAAGQTAEQMKQALEITLPEGEAHAALNALNLTLKNNSMFEGAPVFSFNVANQLWGQKDFAFNEQFLNTLSAYYDANLKTVDFRDSENARALINLWVAAQTNDKIKDLIPEGVLNALTRLVLTNAVYFKGSWDTRFDPARTRQADFHISDLRSVQVPMMLQTIQAPYGENELCQWIELPYQGKQMSMMFLLPGREVALDRLEAALSPEKLDSWVEGSASEKVLVSVPRFRMSFFSSMAPVLARMGMPDAFDENRADFSGMTGRKELYLSHVLHKAFVEINEEGTEAAAATAVVVATKSAVLSQQFIADRPFVFLIRDRKTGCILFVGRLADPASDGS